MIEAKHNKLFRTIFNLYINRQLKKHFNNFYLIDEVPYFHDDKSILVLPNHFSWWDGFFVDLLHRKFFGEYKIFMMVLEETIRRFWFFNHIGAFTINIKNPKDILKSFTYASDLLNKKKNFVVIFPQGELKPYSTNVELKTGIPELILRNDIQFHIILLAMKIVYGNEKKPDVYFRFAQIEESLNHKLTTTQLNQLFCENLIQLENKILSYDKIKIEI